MSLTVLDTALLSGIHALLSSPGLDRLMTTVTRLGDLGFIWLLLAAILLCRPATRRAGVLILLAMALGLLFGNGLLKNLVARPRPYTADPGIQLLIEPSREPYSFPSGHTLHAFAAAFAVGLAGRRSLFIPCLILAAAIGFSRIYLMMHYPSDVLAGGLFGFAAAWAAQWLLKRLEPALSRSKRAENPPFDGKNP